MSTYIIISEDKLLIESICEVFEEFPEWKCIGKLSCQTESQNFILKFKPKVVFLDLECNWFNKSFVYIKELRSYTFTLPDFVAISNTKKYAYDAIKNHFVDYITKPIAELEIRKSILRLDGLLEIIKNKRICLKSYSDYHFIEPKDILYLKADNNTTDFYLLSGKKVSAYKTLKYFERRLPNNFIRTHNSYIINSDLVRRINFGKSQISLEVDDVYQCFPFSKSYQKNVDSLKDVLSSYQVDFINS